MATTQVSGPKTYRSVVEGFELVTEFKRSGLSAGEFARQRNITRRSLNYWVGRASMLADAAASSPAPVGFVEVTPPLSLPVPAPSPNYAHALEIRLPSGAIIAVQSGFDIGLLRAVMQAIAC